MPNSVYIYIYIYIYMYTYIHTYIYIYIYIYNLRFLNEYFGDKIFDKQVWFYGTSTIVGY